MNHIYKILKSARELWRMYIVIGVLTMLLSLATLLQPLFSGWAIDEMRKGTGASVKYVAILALLIFLLDLFQNVISNFSGYLGDQMSARLHNVLANRYYEKLLSLPQRFFDQELSGKLINRLNRSIAQIASFMQMMSNNFLQFIFSTLFSLVVVAIYSWEVALMLFALYPIYIWMTFRSSGTWQNYQKKKNHHQDIAIGRFTEAIGQVKVVKSFIKEKHELKFFANEVSKVVAINKPQSKFWHIQDFRRRVVLNIIFLFVYMYIFVQGAQGALTPGQVVTLILYAMQIRIPIFTISFLVENTQRAVADSKDYFEIMNENPQIADRPNAKVMKVTDGAINFADVSFSYDNKQPVIKNINLNIQPDTKIALVGESGEGKTTLTNLLLRLYEPEQGIISIDGQDINEVTQESLRDAIGVVFQESALFSGTIKENIAYAKPGATEKQVIAAAKAANAHEFIEKLEKGYAAQIGERGLKLSGGQKQRIAIARALLKDAPILILDEATSSLDSKSEAFVQDALERLMKGRTTIIIAHRLSTIQNVDQIITLRNGQIDEVGTPAKLAKSQGIYAQLLDLQRGKKTESTKKKLQKYDISA
ncbi:ABC transporter ATP-binding protein [Candidatus Saccharibacteria bacterium]|nr:ABC transporter ATP-binding protein [Candidatus Saccharibacteria bacterium]